MATKKSYFRTPVDEPVTTVTPAGEEVEEVWAMKLDEKGNEVFYIEGKTNVYEKIQAYLEETKIENILQRCIDTNDISILNKVKGQYMDITNMPTNIMEAHSKIKEAEDTFNNLPIEIRKKYEYNFNKYLADFGTEEWQKNMGLIKEESVPDPAEKKGDEKEE